MDQSPVGLVRVLLANERIDRLERAAATVRALGHEVVALATDVEEVGAIATRSRPDVAIVGLGPDPDHALQLITLIAKEATCPVVALLGVHDGGFVAEAAQRGIFASILESDEESLRNAIEIVLLRFAEYSNLASALARRVVTERAKGILMERHAIDERLAFTMLRDHARRNNRKLVDIAAAVIDGRALFRAR